MENKINLETAENEFNRFGDSMDLDFDMNLMNEDTKKDFELHKKRIIKCIMDGSLVISENGEPTYTPKMVDGANPITFYEPTGATLSASDGKGKNESFKMMYSSMADMTKQSAGLFSKMKNRDLKVCISLYLLFLGQ